MARDRKTLGFDPIPVENLRDEPDEAVKIVGVSDDGELMSRGAVADSRMRASRDGCLL